MCLRLWHACVSTQPALGRGAVLRAQKSMQLFLRATLDFLYLARYHPVYMREFLLVYVVISFVLLANAM